MFERNIVQGKDFLQKYDRFLVLDSQDYEKKCPLQVRGLENVDKWKNLQSPQWLELRILANSAYRVQPLVKRGWETVLLVEKVG